MSVRGSSASQQRSLHHSARCARYAFASLGLPAGRQVAHRVRSQRQAVTLTCRSPPCGRPFSHTVKWDGAEKLHRSGWRRHGQIFCCMQNPHSQALWVVHGSTTAWMQEVEQRRSSCRDSAASGTAVACAARSACLPAGRPQGDLLQGALLLFCGSPLVWAPLGVSAQQEVFACFRNGAAKGLAGRRHECFALQRRSRAEDATTARNPGLRATAWVLSAA